ncbi:hypothetical protein FC12_GL000762 [Lacticaseibacillus paracasei subsp. tolerans DSM 20258]|nr:hypothetical protein FC12_GL000762 [Lacticaseibacillus paracasei subsp. tolerans DSM 20258]
MSRFNQSNVSLSYGINLGFINATADNVQNVYNVWVPFFVAIYGVHWHITIGV